MFQVHEIAARDLANQRSREAEALAARHAIVAELRASSPAGGSVRSRLRRTVAAALRAVSSGAGSIAQSACWAATRLDQPAG